MKGEEVELKGNDYPKMLLEMLVELHATNRANTNLLIDLAAGLSTQSREELTESMNKAVEHEKKVVLEFLYSEYGELPPYLKDWLRNNQP